MESAWIGRVLLEHSTTKYFIEYGQYLSNHLVHGIIALHQLGATEERVHRFIKWYDPKLEKPQGKGHKEEQVDAEPASEDDVVRLLGKRKGYYSLVNYYEKELKECGSTESLVYKHFASVSAGLAASLLHGLIHLGYGMSAKNDKIVCEAMAYLRHSYAPIKYDNTREENNIERFGQGKTNIVEVLSKIQKDEALRTIRRQGEKKLRDTEWISSTPQYRNAALLEYGDRLIEYANQIEVSAVKGEDERGMDFVVKVSEWLLDQFIAVYTLLENKNDFIMLHAVTSAWSMRQIIGHLDPQDGIMALRTLICVLLATYISQECPNIRGNVTPTQTSAAIWKEIIEEALSRDIDEHIYKLIQVCYNQWCHLQDKGSDKAALYVTAARTSLDFELYFLKYENVSSQ